MKKILKKALIIKNTPILQGITKVPGDKSISHRCLILAGLASGKSIIKGLLMGTDCLVTLNIMRILGVHIKFYNDKFEISGIGIRGLIASNKKLDCVNSATTMRLLCGILVGQNEKFTLVGSHQLLSRPMARIIEPLQLMGAKIESNKNSAPLKILSNHRLNGIEYAPKIASAQVKSAILLAGLYAAKKTSIIEIRPTRNHTELMLKDMGANIKIYNKKITIWPLKNKLLSLKMNIPGDTSSAAFLIVAASAKLKCKILIKEVLLNQTRTGIIDALIKMGANIKTFNEHFENSELVGDIAVEGAVLKGATFLGDEIVRMIDELPILVVAATQAKGITIIKDAAELRVKESNRIEVMTSELKKMGANIKATVDGFIIKGKVNLVGTKVSSNGDHRISMTLAVAGLFACGKTKIIGSEVSNDSFPGFVKCINNIGGNIQEINCEQN